MPPDTQKPAEPYRVVGQGQRVISPLLFDAPHSWPDWPADATPTRVPSEVLHTSWDAWVDELWSTAGQAHIPVLAAQFHRAYIDANRARDDIDPEMLASPWPTPVRPSAACQRGMGLVRRYALPGVAMYAAPLTVADVGARLSRYYDPYHSCLEGLINAAQDSFGVSCHIDCHSMKSVGNAMNIDVGLERPDMVVSNLKGASSHPALLAWIVETLTELGFRVQANQPYQGAELVRRHGRPAQNRHSIQIEINRALYMDEVLCIKHAGFDKLAFALTRFVQALDTALKHQLGASLRACGE